MAQPGSPNPATVKAGYLQPPVMALPDGARVCDKPGHACLITYGNGRRMEAVGALGSLGIKPPTWWEL